MVYMVQGIGWVVLQVIMKHETYTSWPAHRKRSNGEVGTRIFRMEQVRWIQGTLFVQVCSR